MTARSLSLVLLSCLFVGQIVNQTNGELSPPWITYRGCYDYITGSRNKTLSDNRPTNCFRECANFTHIGIQDNTCICFENMPGSQRIFHYYCQLHSRSDKRMSLYSKVIQLPYKVSQADYGYVYISTQPFEFHASNSSSEKHGECSEDRALNCTYHRFEDVSGSEANPAHPLVSYLDFNNSCQKPQDGSYWIGMFRETPVFSLSTEASSTNIPPRLSSSSQQTFPISVNKQTSFTQTVSIISSANKSTPSSIAQTSSASSKTDLTPSTQYREPTSYSEGKPEDTWKIIAIAFVVITVALTIFIIAGLVAFLRRKKENQISDRKDQPTPGVGDTENLETDKRSQNSLPLRLELRKELEGNHTLERKTKHRKHSQDGQSDQTIQNPEILEKRRKHRNSHHHEETDVTNLAGTAVEHNPEIREKKRKRRKSHHHEETDVTKLSDTAVEHNLLDNLEQNNKTKKKKRKRKKGKNKHVNTS